MPAFKNKSKLQILSIDIGGSFTKATILDSKGKMLHPYVRKATPFPASPGNLLTLIRSLTEPFPSYDCISAGFPGYVKNGVVVTAPNLGTGLWAGTDFSTILEKELGKPARVVNDADMQGLGVVRGEGLELVATLGTGFGTALFLDGMLLPHLELAHHPVTARKDYDQYIGEAALLKIGEEKWNKRMERVLNILKTVFNYDTLYLGGGNVRKLAIPLDKNIKKVSNRDGIRGGARLWASREQTQTTEAIFNTPQSNRK